MNSHRSSLLTPSMNKAARPDRAVVIGLSAAAVAAAAAVWQVGAPLLGWVVPLLLAAGAASVVVQDRYGARAGGFLAIPAWTVAAANAALALPLLYFHSAYDAILLVGAVLLMTAFLYHRANGTAPRGFLRQAVAVNILLSLALVLTLPEINGASVLFRYAKFPTSASLFGGSARNVVQIDARSQVLMRESWGTLAEIELRADRRLRDGQPMFLRLAPHRVSEFDLHYVDLMSYVGYDAKRVTRIEGDGMMTLEVESRRLPLPLERQPDAVRIPPGPDADAPVWVTIPAPLDGEELAASPARKRNAISALLYWQVGFFAFMMLAPRRRDDGRG